jgi:predicted cupin superfamily sugar epimerase
MNAQEVIQLLGLAPLPREGGFFRETYRSSEVLEPAVLPPPYASARAISTSIYYFLTPPTRSRIHRLPTEEIFHFYAGDPVEMLALMPDGRGHRWIIGNDLGRGQSPQVVVPRGTWQGCRLVNGGEWALLGTTMAPGFDFADYDPGDREELIRDYPGEADLIRELLAD